MEVVQPRPGQCAVCDELVLLDKIAGKSWTILSAIRLGEETDFLVVWLVGWKSAQC